MSYDTILVERENSIGKLIFNRPDVLNAYNKTLSDELTEGINELAEDESIQIIIITGKGRAFMAGADINMIMNWSKMGTSVNVELKKMFKTTILQDCPKPIIAAVNGLAFGMGCEIAMACDFRIAAESAMFGQPEIKIGILPGAGGTQRLLRLVGATKALEMVMTGEPIDANEAYRIGLVNKVVADDLLGKEVESLIKLLLSKSPLGLAMTKRLIHEGSDMNLKDALNFELECFSEIVITEDAREGADAFLKRRKPEFKGR